MEVNGRHAPRRISPCMVNCTDRHSGVPGSMRRATRRCAALGRPASIDRSNRGGSAGSGAADPLVPQRPGRWRRAKGRGSHRKGRVVAARRVTADAAMTTAATATSTDPPAAQPRHQVARAVTPGGAVRHTAASSGAARLVTWVGPPYLSATSFPDSTIGRSSAQMSAQVRPKNPTSRRVPGVEPPARRDGC